MLSESGGPEDGQAGGRGADLPPDSVNKAGRSPLPWPHMEVDIPPISLGEGNVDRVARPFGEEGFPVTSLMELFPWYHSSYDDLERFRPDLAAAAARATCRELDPFVLVPAARKR